jgi:hypothetical protein
MHKSNVYCKSKYEAVKVFLWHLLGDVHIVVNVCQLTSETRKENGPTAWEQGKAIGKLDLGILGEEGGGEGVESSQPKDVM